MNKNLIIRGVLLTLIILFPFRWAFLEYPEPIMVNNISVDGGGIAICFAMVVTIFGSILTFYFTSKDKTITK